jgi:hypothetical protein
MQKIFVVIVVLVVTVSACAPVNTAPLPIAVSQATDEVGVVTVNNIEATATPISGGLLIENDVCDNPYYPVVNGAWWQYNISTGGTPMHTMSANEDKIFTITVTGDNTTFTLDGSCTDEGIILLEVPGVSATTTTEGGSSKLPTTNDDGVTLPNDVQVGDDWSQSISVIADGGAGTFSAHIETNYKAVGFEIVSTPYGPINALKVEQTGTLSMGELVTMDIHGYVWYGQGIGVVKTTVDDSFEGTIAAYNIPQP